MEKVDDVWAGVGALRTMKATKTQRPFRRGPNHLYQDKPSCLVSSTCNAKRVGVYDHLFLFRALASHPALTLSTRRRHFDEKCNANG